MIRAFVKLHHPLQGYLRLQRRVFSVKAIYSSFPASLVYYSPRHRSSLFDHKEHESRPDDLYEEGVLIAQDGLVYPSVRPGGFPLFYVRNDSNRAGYLPVSNGAVMFPNTFMMQEYVRRYFDELLDRQEDGREADKPWIYTIRKGKLAVSRLRRRADVAPIQEPRSPAIWF